MANVYKIFRHVWIWCLLATLSFSCLQTSLAEGLASADESIVNTGRYIYQRRCAVCHGETGRGDGAFTSLLVVAPSDLTILAQSNGGVFPFDRVLDTISGSELLPAHGARDMPIWGQEFAQESELLGIDSRTLARARILEIMAYLASIQKK